MTDQKRRDFMKLGLGAAGAVGLGVIAWPILNRKTPPDLPVADVDLSQVKPGQSITYVWNGHPVFIRRRTMAEIDALRSVEISALPDPAEDKDRVKRDDWIVVIGVCTHQYCIPGGQKAGESKGAFGGWLCTCHGSHYDASGRIRKGPATKNLAIPPYTFIDDNRLRIGRET